MVGWKFLEEEVDAVYLNLDEIKKIFQVHLSRSLNSLPAAVLNVLYHYKTDNQLTLEFEMIPVLKFQVE